MFIDAIFVFFSAHCAVVEKKMPIKLNCHSGWDETMHSYIYAPAVAVTAMDT